MSDSYESIPTNIIKMIQDNYDQKLNIGSAHLYNKILGSISESKLPIPQIILILQLLLEESTQLAKELYIGRQL